MKKIFEDYFSELQADMVSVCMENVEDRADTVYIYCSCEDNVIASAYFYKINGMVVKRHKLNDAIAQGEAEYDVSGERQRMVLDVINSDIEKLMKICKEHNRDMPTEMKLIYDVKNKSLKAEYRYDLVYTNDPVKTASIVSDDWFEEIKKENGR
ncbi:hypothetical protein [Treponema pedis]|uniref:DUF600 domain-containing protein n=1 Tax=Treponema pedis str. T A4 TaxID=1291379 RepID=S6A3R9_9SPIR|nr:hypothetical protein [Treponema pedis]AGT43826.1 hypothetical protein TPE_1331 [Treponema pedis str. T A4]